MVDARSIGQTLIRGRGPYTSQDYFFYLEEIS